MCVHIPTPVLWSFSYIYCWFSEAGIKEEITAFNNIKVSIREVIWNLKLHCFVTKPSIATQDTIRMLNWTSFGGSQIKKEEIRKLKLDDLSHRGKNVGKNIWCVFENIQNILC